MQWHWPDLHRLLHHLPHAVADMVHHENRELLTAGLSGIQLRETEKKHSLIVPKDAGSSVALEKDMDPSISRSAQNLGLLIHDYLHFLPDYHATTKEAEALLAHWREIIAQQPQRLAEARQSYWNSDHAKQFWRDRISHYRTDFGITADGFPEALDDWERTAGAHIHPHPQMSAAEKTKQWQDLIIRDRMHKLTMEQVRRLN